MPFLALAIIAGIVFIQEGQRRIPVQYAKRVVGRRMAGGGSTYLPLRVNMAGRHPGDLRGVADGLPADRRRVLPGRVGARPVGLLQPQRLAPTCVAESILIILFTYFYTAVTFNPVEQADNLKKHGGFIPGVRPGGPRPSTSTASSPG